jgi:hypothetical protein
MSLLRIPWLVIVSVSIVGCNEITTPAHPGNEPPRIEAPTTVRVNLGDTVHFGVTATDPDEDGVGLTVAVVTSFQERRADVVTGTARMAYTAPYSKEIAAAAVVEFRATEADVPERVLRIMARDVRGASSMAEVRVRVFAEESN